ncbi:MFS transporter [Streptomyces sp. JV176]|uniref:MFS transporter n=1 Tax=Streptomyces sp. JV176 TaxID=858630 RepID=UPI002E788611|nr:MFS transporter [Streptomyces sp. JV176]MEE1799359.1 MFS transporter [Streptomyces sp. JV176]
MTSAPLRDDDPEFRKDGVVVRSQLSRTMVLLLAVTCGAAVANIYYAQPLLPVVSHALGVSEGAGGLIVTASQIGYALSLALLVPLGDVPGAAPTGERAARPERCRSPRYGGSPSLGALYASVALVGVTSAVAQIVVPMAASLAADHERGAVVGMVMSGLLIGIMLARTVAGVLAEFGDWRPVFVFAAGVTVVLAITLRLVLPLVPLAGSEDALSPAAALGGDSGAHRVAAAQAHGSGRGRHGRFHGAVDRLVVPAGRARLRIRSGDHRPVRSGRGRRRFGGRPADRGHARRVTTVGLIVLTGSWGVLVFAGQGARSVWAR